MGTENRAANRANIRKKGSRDGLDPRNEPYWMVIRPRCALGYRKGIASSTWRARYHDADTGEQRYHSLGADTEFDYTEALAAAELWWTQCKEGHAPRPGTAPATVEDAVKRYVENRSAERGKDAAFRDTRQFKQVLYDTPFGHLKLERLKANDVETWRNGLVSDDRSKVTANRIYRSFVAAMNYAFRQRMIHTDAPWKAVRAFPVAEQARQNFLTFDERQELLANCPDELRDFLTALLYTGARPGEIEKVRVRDLHLMDTAHGSLKLVSSKGRGGADRKRDFPLSGPALAFFKRCAKDKTPAAFLVGGEAWGRTQWSRALRKAVAKCNDTRREEAAKHGTKFHPFPSSVVCYDMRHIAISEWLQAGIDIGTVAKLAGTSVVMIDKHYHKFIRTAVQDKLAAVSVV